MRRLAPVNPKARARRGSGPLKGTLTAARILKLLGKFEWKAWMPLMWSDKLTTNGKRCLYRSW